MKESKLTPIGKETVVDQIVNEISNLIISGSYKTGMKLPSEFELMDKMCVSRASVREAMKVLSTLGIIEVRRGDGTYVSSNINTSLFDKVIYSMICEKSSEGEMLELRQVLDEATMHFAMSKITPQELMSLETNLEEMKSAIADADFDTIKKKDYEFHQIMISSCKNTFFKHIMDGVYGIFEKIIYDTVNTEKIDTKAAYYHKQMIECLKNKRAQDIHTIVEDSLSSWKETTSSVAKTH